MLTLEGGLVVDADGAREADVEIEDGEIVAVGTVDPDDADDTERTDVPGRVVAPGLVDAHVHLWMDGRPDVATLPEESVETGCYRAAANLRRTLEAGVTTVRDLGAPGRIALDAAAAVGAGTLPGPRVRAAGRNVTMTGGHGHWFGREADGPAEVRKAAREQLKAGADVVKCMATGGVLTEGAITGAPELGEAELEAVTDAAGAKGVPTAAHAHGAAGIKNAARAGITSVEHGTFMDREAADLLVRRGASWVPTVSALRGIVDNGVEAGIPSEAVGKAEEAADHLADAFEHALDAGVTVAMGTDAGTPFNHHGAAALDEVEFLVDHGLTPAAALEAATVNAATLLGLDDVGRVREGYRADLLVLEANPLEDPSAWRESTHVLQAGEVIRGPDD